MISTQTETRFHGLAISGGVALARTCLFRHDHRVEPPDYRVEGEGIDREKERLKMAVAASIEHVESLRQTVAERVGAAEAEIFTAQRLILEDPVLERQLTEAIEAGYNAETAVLRTMEAYESRMMELDNAYMRERVSDLSEIKRRLIDRLCDVGPAFACASEPECQRGYPRIIVTEELTPSLALELNAEEILGIVTERGGLTSHAAILARALGVPAISGITHVHDLINCGTEMIINGDSGEIIVWPSKETVAEFHVGGHSRVARVAVEPVEALRVMANISGAHEVCEVRRMRAEGIGLYRTELEFFAAGRVLTEDEQVDRYLAVLKAMDGHVVYFRLLDVGGDKTIASFELPAEENPALGLRGARFLLSRPELLRGQARALARISVHGTVNVMYPMIVGLDQFLALRRRFEEAIADVPHGVIRHGVMFEVPSAVLEAREILEHADFASIGSNDLVQYLFAVDRNNELVADDFTPDRPVFWRLLTDLVRLADEAGRPLTLCGEMAADPRYIARLMALGIRTVSVSPRHIPVVRRAAKEAMATR